MNDNLMAGKIALVTMSTFGICGKVAEDLAAKGADAVIVNGRTAASGKPIADALQARFPKTKVHYIAADITKRDAIDAMFREVETEFGGLDVLVHAGTAYPPHPPELFEKQNPDIFQSQADGLYLSLAYSCHHAIPLLKKRGGGAIVALTSDGAKVPTPGETFIGGCLAASCMLIRTLAVELGRAQIRANAVTPSIVRGTRSYEIAMSADFSRQLFEKAEKRAKLGVPSAENVAPMIVFLASPLASHITGQVISVNGGISVA